MKRIIKKSTLWALLGLMISSCLKPDDLRENPNDPQSVPPSLLLTSVTPRPTVSFSDQYGNAQYHTWLATDAAVAWNYESEIRTDGFTYGTIRDINAMIKEAETANAPAYGILAKFFTARQYFEMTRSMGEVPLSEAMQGAEIPQPKYDSQESIFLHVLNLLDEANNELGAYIAANPSVIVEGDFYYGGNLAQWQKLINAHTLRVLINLSKRADDTPSLNIKGRFANIVNNPAQYPLLSGLADNAQITHSNEEGFRASYQPNNGVYQASVIYCDTYIDILKGFRDPRLMIVADPTKDALDANPGDEAAVRADFDSYVGTDISENGASANSKKLDGDFSIPNQERYWNFVGQPSILMAYWEQELTIAEAAHLGWVAVDPKTYYDSGVRASMEFYGVAEDAITAYLAAADSQYIAGDAGLTRILEQKYIAFAENSGWESFFTNRRTGVPTFKFSSENIITQFPVRWRYPTSELTENEANYKAALQRQFGSEVDDNNGVIWMIK